MLSPSDFELSIRDKKCNGNTVFEDESLCCISVSR